VKKVRDKLAALGFMSKGKPRPKFMWVHYTHSQILASYNAIMISCLNYYSFVRNYSNLVSMTYFTLYGSCAKLLAAKFSLGSVGKVVAKFGKQLSSRKNSLYKPKYAATHEFRVIPTNPETRLSCASTSTSTSENLAYGLGGPTCRVEVQHIKRLVNIKKSKSVVDRPIVSTRKKQTPLCRSCSVKHHRSSSGAR
jgi:hypothetical protein